MSTRLSASLATALALSLALTSCGLLRDLGEDAANPDNPGEQAEEERDHAELPFVRQSRMFVEGGEDVTFELTVTNLEHNGEYLMLEVEQNFLEPVPGTITGQGAPVRLVDPVSGEVLRTLEDPEHGELFGTYFVEGDPFMPTHEGLPTTIRRYLPAPSEDVERLTLTGAGAGHIPGVPVDYVDEFTEAPEPDAHEYIDPDTFEQDPELPDEIWYPDNVPPSGLETADEVQPLESFVDSSVASVTRAGRDETLALHSDSMFDVDESEPSDEGAETINAAALSLLDNLGEDATEITVIGHTDSQGEDDYNQTLSEERAEAVSELLADQLDSNFTFTIEGRGSDELLADEDGDDEEEARARNRRVEFSYEVPLEAGDQEEQEGLDAAERHVVEPAEYFEELEQFTTVEHGDVDLNVYPMVRDGAYVFQMVGFENSTMSDLEADLSVDDTVAPGSPDQYTEGTMGGFHLEDPDHGIIRYVNRIRTGQDEYEDFADEIHTLTPGEEYLALAVFPAPPSEVGEMTLHAGAFGEIPDVPIH